MTRMIIPAFRLQTRPTKSPGRRKNLHPFAAANVSRTKPIQHATHRRLT